MPNRTPLNYLWPAIGFALGTGMVGTLVLSSDVRERGLLGLVLGGIPFGLIGLWYAIYQSRRTDC